MTKIAIDARQYSTSTGRYISRLVQYLQQVDQTNTYTILLKPEDMNKFQPVNPGFTKLACPYKEYTFGEQLGFLRQLKGLKPDLVHFGMTQQPILYHRPKITTIHDLTTARFTNPDKNPLVFKVKQQIYKFVIKSATKHSQAIITPTDYVKQDVVAFTGAAAEKVHVTYESADTITDPAEQVAALKGSRFIMYIGRPTPHKNLLRLIEAFNQLQGSHPHLKLVLAGKLDANYRQIQQELQPKQKANIIFTDFISEGQLRWLLENCSAYVFPSLSEGFGLPGIEAMIHGAPVVSSNATCLPEVYGDAAHYFDPLDVDNMTNAINEVLTNNTLRTRLISAGHDRAADFSWLHMAEQTVALYNKTLL